MAGACGHGRGGDPTRWSRACGSLVDGGRDDCAQVTGRGRAARRVNAATRSAAQGSSSRSGSPTVCPSGRSRSRRPGRAPARGPARRPPSSPVARRESRPSASRPVPLSGRGPPVAGQAPRMSRTRYSTTRASGMTACATPAPEPPPLKGRVCAWCTALNLQREDGAGKDLPEQERSVELRQARLIPPGGAQPPHLLPHFHHDERCEQRAYHQRREHSRRGVGRPDPESPLEKTSRPAHRS